MNVNNDYDIREYVTINDIAKHFDRSKQWVFNNIKRMGIDTYVFSKLHLIHKKHIAKFQQRPNGYVRLSDFARELGADRSTVYNWVDTELDILIEENEIIKTPSKEMFLSPIAQYELKKIANRKRPISYNLEGIEND